MSSLIVSLIYVVFLILGALSAYVFVTMIGRD